MSTDWVRIRPPSPGRLIQFILNVLRLELQSLVAVVQTKVGICYVCGKHRILVVSPMSSVFREHFLLPLQVL